MKKELLKDLAKIGVCKTGKRYLYTTTQDLNTLIKIWKGWPEYWYEHSEYAIRLMRYCIDDIDKVILQKENLYLDTEGMFEVGCGESVVFIVGSSNITMVMKEYTATKIYIFNDSKVKINCSSTSIVNVEAWNDSSVKIESGKGVVYIYVNARACVNEPVSVV
ncbi:MAG: hypothetical protein RR057_06690, partial [Clostridia bacterium]